jgi:Uma2 family endonuclease
MGTPGARRPRDPGTPPRHQWSSKRLQRQLEDYFEARALGRIFNAPIDVILTPHDVVQPDLVIVAQGEQVSPRGIEGPPLLLVEVLSPSTVAYDRATKSRRYAELGVPHLWFLDPANRRLECVCLETGQWRLVLDGERDMVLEHPDWPGLRLRLGDLWM